MFKFLAKNCDSRNFTKKCLFKLKIKRLSVLEIFLKVFISGNSLYRKSSLDFFECQLIMFQQHICAFYILLQGY